MKSIGSGHMIKKSNDLHLKTVFGHLKKEEGCLSGCLQILQFVSALATSQDDFKNRDCEDMTGIRSVHYETLLHVFCTCKFNFQAE